MADVVDLGIAFGAALASIKAFGRFAKSKREDREKRTRHLGRLDPTGTLARLDGPRRAIADVDAPRHRQYDANPGGIEARVGRIVTLIRKGKTDPKIRTWAVETVSKKCGRNWCIPERDYWGEAKAIFYEVRRRVRYVRDPIEVDTFTAARWTLKQGGGDCDDYVILLGAGLAAIGYPVKARVYRTKDSPDWNHIALLVGLPPRAPKRWVTLDASVAKPPGWGAPKEMVARVRDFEVPR